MRFLLIALFVVPTVFLGACGNDEKTTRVAFVTNGSATFWNIARAGAQASAKAEGIDVEVAFPADLNDQERLVRGYLARGMKGIAISPINGEAQAPFLTTTAEQVPLITHDSDSPKSKRLCYVGMDNYEAGLEVGRLVKEAIPDGGEVMLFIGRLTQDNALLRRQGVIDILLGREPDRTRRDPPDFESKNGKWQIAGTRLDEFSQARAKENAQAALTGHPNLKCMVGLFAYNPPACLSALKSADKLGKVRVVAFDEDDATLQGILDGHVLATVVQNPYEYGFKSVQVLAALARGDKSLIPASGYIEIPHRIIRQDNCQSFWDDLRKKVAAAGE